MKSLIVILLVLPFIAVSAEAQVITRANGQQIKTGPVTVNDRIEYRLREMSLAMAQATIVRMRVDNFNAGTYPYSTLQTPNVCHRQGNFNICDNPLPAEMVKLINVVGTHRVYVYTFNNITGESSPSEPWTITTPK